MRNLTPTLILTFFTAIYTVPTVIDKCRACTITAGTSKCNVCVTGYTPSANQTACIASANCAGDWNPQTKLCMTCQDGYYITSSTGICTSTAAVPNCRVYLNATACAVCNDNYFLANTAGTACSGQAHCDPASVGCSQCIGGYYSTGSFCKAQAGCSSSANAKCASCNYYEKGNAIGGYTYTQANATCDKPATEVANCFSYAPGTSNCTQCNINYYLSAANNCTSSAKCFYTQSNACYSCYPTFYNLVETTCTQCGNNGMIIGMAPLLLAVVGILII